MESGGALQLLVLPQRATVKSLFLTELPLKPAVTEPQTSSVYVQQQNERWTQTVGERSRDRSGCNVY